MSGEALIENRMSPWLFGSKFECAREVGKEICSLVKAALGTLGDELWRGRGGVLEDLWEGELLCCIGWRGCTCRYGLWY